MLLTCFRRAYRDRRRLLLAVTLNLAAGQFGFGVLPGPIPGIASEVLVAGAFLGLIPVLTFRFRGMRHWVEIVALGKFVVTLHGHLLPGGVFGWHDVLTMLFFQIPGYFGLLIALRTMLYGRWSDPLTLRRRVVVTAKLRTWMPIKELWLGVVPTPGFIAHNPVREVVSIQFADISKRVVRRLTRIPPRAGTGEVLMSFDDITPLADARFRLSTVRGVGDADAELLFENRGHHRVLGLRHKVNGFTPRRILMGYLDDTFGRLLAARLDAIEARYAGAQTTETTVPLTTWFDCADGALSGVEPALRGCRAAFGRARSTEETRALEALGRL